MSDEARELSGQEEQYYGALLRGYYDLSLLYERNIINWGTAAIAGLLAIGLAGRLDVSLGWFLIWVLALVFFVLSVALSHFGVVYAIKRWGKELRAFPDNPKGYKDSKALARVQNGVIGTSFVLGLITSVILVLKLIIS
jgi:hypothetical protein